MLNGDAHHTFREGEQRIRPSLSKTTARGIYHMTPLTILHVEDHLMVAQAVRDVLEAEGWRVVTCTNGHAAVNRLTSGNRYDLLITDNQLPGASGLEVVRYARSLPRRARMPIVMFSATDCGAEAYRAGVNVFLRKPEDAAELVTTVARLLNQGAWG